MKGRLLSLPSLGVSFVVFCLKEGQTTVGFGSEMLEIPKSKEKAPLKKWKPFFGLGSFHVQRFHFDISMVCFELWILGG